DFVVNGKGRNAQQQQPDNINFFANAMDWLADDTGLISLRTKGVTARPLDDLENGTKTTLKYMNFLLPLILIVLYGILRTQQRKHRRYKRMQPHYTK
nr:ABC transporter [Salinivirgaceae bacterium]